MLWRHEYGGGERLGEGGQEQERIERDQDKKYEWK